MPRKVLLTHDAEAGAIYIAHDIELESGAKLVETVELANPGPFLAVNADLDKNGNLVGIEIIL